MGVLVGLVLIATGLFFAWSGLTLLRGPRPVTPDNAGPYAKTRLNRGLLIATAWLGAVLGPAIALVGCVLLAGEAGLF